MPPPPPPLPRTKLNQNRTDNSSKSTDASEMDPQTSRTSTEKPQPASSSLSFDEVQEASAQRVGIYGPGGIGKTTLACHAPMDGKVVFIDLEKSLPVLKAQLGGRTPKSKSPASWEELRALVRAPIYDGVKTIVLDTATRAEILCTQYVLRTVKHEKGGSVHRVEDYGFGKGYKHIQEEFLKLLMDLDHHIEQGRNVVILMHEHVVTVPNPGGEDWLRYEPRLQSMKNGNILAHVKEWLDHLICIRYDVSVTTEKRLGAKGKGEGSGTATCYPKEMPVHMAKSRSLSEPIDLVQGQEEEFWKKLLGEGAYIPF